MTNEQIPLMELRCPPGVGTVDGIIEGHRRYQALLAALDLGLFEFLDMQGIGNCAEIAAGIGINDRFARSFLDVLVEVGLLARSGEQYRNSRAATDFLLPESPFYQGDAVCSAVRNSPWNDLAAALTRTGLSQGNAGSSGPGAAFITALGQRALRGELQAVSRAIADWRGFTKARRLLDVGGGHGLYSIALCQANPALHGVVLDQAGVVDCARRNIASHGLAERITVAVGDCGVSLGAAGETYDIVLISHLLYKFRSDLGAIFAAVHACLNPGGLLVSNHWFGAAARAPGDSAVQGLSNALQSFGHPLCRAEEFDRQLADCGFNVITTTAAPASFGLTRLQLAEKRAHCQ